MHILVIAGAHVEAEFREKFGQAHTYTFWEPGSARAHEDNENKVGITIVESQRTSPLQNPPDVVFIFKFQGLGSLELSSKCFIFKEASQTASWGSFPGGATFGFCGLPTLLNRRLLEVSLYHEADRAKLAETCAALGTDYRVVADRVGLVTPRVICMIINEACFTVQEGTATMQDVDLGMQLGTSYPRGPFAWANAIGVERVYAVLEAMWHDTHDERYKVCPLLKRQALRGEPFAV